MHVNGNKTTALMHLLVWTELQRLRVNQAMPITHISAEQSVILAASKMHRLPREGKYDFVVETPRKTIGFEVLTRPTKGKLLKKLPYKDEVDEYVFVIPHDSLLPYQKTPKNHGWKVREKKLPPIFAQKGLSVWLVDLDEQCITEKHPFPQIYNVEANHTIGGK